MKPRPHQGLPQTTPTKRNIKTFRPGTRPGATRPRLGAASLTRKVRLFLLEGSSWPAASSLRNAAELTKVRPSRPTSDVRSTFATL
eukprot:6362771-Amphidinium_carterae.1